MLVRFVLLFASVPRRGETRDSGVFSYPRYRIELNQVPLSESGEHRSAFWGVPSEKMSLRFDVVGKTGRNAKELGSLTTLYNSDRCAAK